MKSYVSVKKKLDICKFRNKLVSKCNCKNGDGNEWGCSHPENIVGRRIQKYCNKEHCSLYEARTQ